MNTKSTEEMPIVPGVEDNLYYVISEDCVMCGICAEKCPANAITALNDRYEIIPEKCIDCGICSYICPSNIPKPV